ncbi:hypothetical protein NE584_00640 [Clostridium sp. DFI.5.61]|nr:hypothetical protein [Clostridium sp. DFI.5.61]MCQ5157547.1 hypothetical protein [Clostridium sp. DFI.5.61]
MIDNDVPLNCIIGLPIPFARGFVQIQVVAEGQFLQSGQFHLIGVMDDDFGPYRCSISEAFGQNGADRIFMDIVLSNETGVVCDANWLPAI